MADLIAIGYPDETTALSAMDETERLQHERIIQADALAAIRLPIWEERISSLSQDLREHRKSHDPTLAQLVGILAGAA